MMGFSLIVCCYNSVNRIENTLRHIFDLKIIDSSLFEIIIVNNNSTDNTKTFVDYLEKRDNRQQFKFKVIDEPTPGLSFARTAGVNASSFEVMCFCDDDNHLKADYIIEADKILSTDNDIGIVGGLSLPKFPISVGEWVKDFYAAMAIGPQGKQDGYVNWVYGAGMVIKKEIFKKLEINGIKFQLSDRAGKILTSGGDAEICMLASFVNYKIYYSSDMVLHHAIPENRLKKKHYMKAKYNTIYPSIYLDILHSIIGNNDARVGNLYKKQVLGSLSKLLYFSPRMFLGKHKFYSLFSFYRISQQLIWCLFNLREFQETYALIKKNLKLSHHV